MLCLNKNSTPESPSPASLRPRCTRAAPAAPSAWGLPRRLPEGSREPLNLGKPISHELTSYYKPISTMCYKLRSV